MEYSNYEKVNIAANKISSKTKRLSFLLEQLSLWERNKPTWKQDPICNFENVYDRTIRLIKCDINTLELTLKYTTKQQSISSQQLKTKLTDTQLNTLADGLISNGFINEADKECFIWALGGSEKIDRYNPVQWIKTNSTTKGIVINKKSLLNLLDILKVPHAQIINKSLLNKLFNKAYGSSIKFTGSNYSDGYISEYNNLLIELTKKAKTTE